VVELTVQAVLTGSRDHVYQAAQLDPNCSSGQCVSGGPTLVGVEALAPALGVLLGTCPADNRDEAGVSLKRCIHL
jgi:hypothetical protein